MEVLGLDITSRLIESGFSDRPSSKGQNEVLHVALTSSIAGLLSHQDPDVLRVATHG